ncbi:hypothetical protein SARC_14268, partial [Sphaeroforma arctica JP610]
MAQMDKRANPYGPPWQYKGQQFDLAFPWHEKWNKFKNSPAYRKRAPHKDEMISLVSGYLAFMALMIRRNG